MKLNIYLNTPMDINCLHIYALCTTNVYIHIYTCISFIYSICLNFNRNNKKTTIYILIEMGAP